MPITITCEHCEEKAQFAVDADDNEVVLKRKVVISKGQRHICGSAICLVKELEYRSKTFSDGRFYFPDIRRMPVTSKERIA